MSKHSEIHKVTEKIVLLVTHVMVFFVNPHILLKSFIQVVCPFHLGGFTSITH